MAKTQMVEKRLECHNIRKSFGSVVVLSGLSFALDPGETLAIMGRSGSGKTTLLKCINFIEQPDDGDCVLEGQEYMKTGRPQFSLAQVRARIGIVFQDFNLFPNLTVLRNMTLALEKAKGLSKREAERRAREMADKLGIETTLHRYPSTLSGGQAQRVALGRAMLLEPVVLLLDEITAALDPETTHNVVKAIAEVRALDGGEGLSIIIVTHLLPFAVEFADRIAFLHDGRILEEHRSVDFIHNCEHQETKAFVSLSKWSIGK